MSQFKTFLILIAVFLPLQLSAGDVIRFGLFPTAEVKSMIRMFSPLAEIIQAQTGIKVQLLSASSKTSFNKRTSENRYDLIWTCNACYFNVHKTTGFTAIARGIPAYKGVVFVRKDSEIRRIEDLKGKTIAAVSPKSVAGYLFLRNRLMDIGLAEGVDYRVQFFGKTTSIPFKVYNKKFDAGVFSQDNFVRSPIFNKIGKELKTIAQSIEIPQFPFAVRKNLNPELTKKLSAVFSGISKTEPLDKMFLDMMNLEGMMVITDKDYDEFRKVYKKIKLYNDRIKK